ncbi:hypothetical protein GOEFS_119_00130 [Gordonia effusa NBRC 100432]|uniref:Uncharacterized protein n=1 Tax=Gordonia effusa NBRC 100432 TaxID=1077974 RepID=H0R622_9ACTN|nr:hypothetical protein [Gordonia effusa]GAB20523.1 hypothetical protein GOEFS_119_00130 [Gordonia effusa NBRC 100432]
MSETDLHCDWCTAYPNSLPASTVETAAKWGVTVRDCCNTAVVDYLLCADHWSLLRDQQFPSNCPSCNAPAVTLDDIVVTVMPLGTYDLDDLEPACSGQLLTYSPGALPAAIRLPCLPATADSKTHTETAASEQLTLAGQPAVAMKSVAETVVPDGDYMMIAETHWIDARQTLIWQRDHNDYQVPLDELTDQLRRARAANDHVAAHQIAVVRSELQYERSEFTRHAFEDLKHDQHAFALWRQTSDGQYFIEWTQRAYTVMSFIATVTEKWESGWRAALATIPVAEREAHRTKQWVVRPRRHHLMRHLLSASIAVTAVAAVLGVVMGPAWFLVAALGAATCGYALLAGRDAAWVRTNAATGEFQRDQRVQRFGFDPLDAPDMPAPNWSTTHPDPLGYAESLHSAVLDGFTTHPSPAVLPEPHYPAVSRPESVSLPELKAALVSIVQR